jgi:hypothetical protein
MKVQMSEFDVAVVEKMLNDVKDYKSAVACANACDNTRQSQKELSEINARWKQNPVDALYLYNSQLASKITDTGRAVLDELINKFNDDVGSKMGIFSYSIMTPSEYEKYSIEQEKRKADLRQACLTNRCELIDKQISRYLDSFGRTVTHAENGNLMSKATVTMFVGYAKSNPHMNSDYSALKKFIDNVNALREGTGFVHSESFKEYANDESFVAKFSEIGNKYYEDVAKLVERAEKLKD